MINVNLFAHILLDPELQGRFGLQGNTFTNTVGYFNAYLESIDLDELAEENKKRLKALSSATQQLIQGENALLSLNVRNTTITKGENILAWTETLVPSILNLAPGQNERVLLPGGWLNRDGGHAMIYEFTKNPDDALVFSIYNSGAGLNRHAKHATTREDQYYPIQSYLIPQPINPHELNQLLYQLAVANTPNQVARKIWYYDEKILYDSIEKSMDYLDATVIPASGYPLYCMPRHDVKDQYGTNCYVWDDNKLSYIRPDATIEDIAIPLGQKDAFLQQLNTLKGAKSTLYLSSATLQQLITQHTNHHPLSHHYTTAGQISGTCSQRAIHQMIKTSFDTREHYEQFILKFKMHALRDFIQTHDNPSPKIAELIALAIENNLRILQKPGVFSESIYQELLTLQATRPLHTSPPVLEATSQSASAQTPLQLNTTAYTPFESQSSQELLPLHLIKPDFIADEHASFSEQLDTLHQLCETQAADSRWVMQQIQRVMMQWPLLNHSAANHASVKDTEHLLATLNRLQQAYMKACEHCLGHNRLPETIVTQLSFMSQQANIHAQLAHTIPRPSLMTQLSGKLAELLQQLDHNPAMKSLHPDVDKRLQQLHQRYKNTSESSRSMQHYLELIEETPPLLTQLETHYHQDITRKLNESERQILKSEKAEALYTLLQYQQNDDSFSLPEALNEGAVESLLAIQHDTQFENHFMESALFLTPNKKHQSKNLRIQFEYKLGFSSIKWESPSSIALALDYRYQKDHTYSPASAALSELNPSLNTVQLKISSPLERQLYHLRASPADQVHFTLNYFKKMPSELIDTNNQRYLEANLLEPNRIHDALQQGSFLTDFDEFMQQMLQSPNFVHSHGQIKQEGLFLLRTSVEVNRYLLQTLPNKAVAQRRMMDDVDRLNAQISITSDPSLLASLHRYRLLCLCAQDDLLQNPEVIQNALTSYFYNKAHSNHHDTESTADKFNREKLEYRLVFQLQQLAKTTPINTLLNPLVTALLNLNLAECQIIGTYPIFTVSQGSTSYTLHVEKGRIYSADFTLVPLPEPWLNHPFLTQLKLIDRPCWESRDGLTIEFPPDVRVKQNSQHQILSIQKKWRINQEEAWYELQPTALTRYPQLDARAVITPQLLKIINDKDTEFWVKEGGIGSFIYQSGQPCYVVNDQSEFEQLDDNGLKNGNILQHQSDVHARIAAFESPDFTLVQINPATQQGTIECPRYGLSLQVNANANAIHLTDNSEFKLIDNTAPFATNIARLTFSDGLSTQCIIPVQEFYVNGANQPQPGEYFTFIHDTSNYIESFKNQNSASTPWQYTRSGKTITYCIEQGHAKPKNAAEALYLVYLYLGQHDQDKAWQMLETIRQNFSLTGSVDEQIYLSWIGSRLPHPTDSTSDAAKPQSPRDLLCQLKAMALYTDFLAQGHTPEPIPGSHSQANCVYWFNQDLPSRIENDYNQWLKMAKHIKQAFYSLEVDERKSLLSTIETPPLAAIGYGAKEMQLNTLVTLKNRLAAKFSATPHPPKGYAQQLLQLDEQINALAQVKKSTTVVETIVIPLKLSIQDFDKLDTRYSENKPSEARLPSFNLESINLEKLVSDTYFPTLDSSCEHYKVQNQLNSLLQIASMRRSGDNFYTQKLEQFCIHTLRHEARQALDPKHNPSPIIPDLNLLYRVLHHPSCVDNLPKNATVRHLIEITQALDIPAIDMTYEQDTYTELLASTDAMIKNLEKNAPTSTPIMLQPLHQLPLHQHLGKLIPENTALGELLNQGFVDMQHVARVQEETMDELNPHDEEREQKAGACHYQLVQEQRHIADETLGLVNTRQTILDAATTYVANLQPLVQQQWDSLLVKANQALKTNQAIQLATGQRRLLTRDDILSCYLHNDYAHTIELTQLSQEACKQLHDAVHACLSNAILLQQASRLKDELNRLDANPDPISLNKIAQLLLSETDVRIENDPTLMLFQYLNQDNEGQSGMVLRKRQVDALQNLLATPDSTDSTRFNESIEKVIMGGGKSKVLLPLLAQKKATGSNLVIIEVPQALLKTNFNDLKQTSQILFGQKAYCFEFNRDSDVSPARLDQLFNQFNDMMVQKSYLVTTGESIQSLELKYLELLLAPPQHPNAKDIWDKQMTKMSHIINLLKHHGDAILDEVHQGLLLKKKLNYTLGDSKPIPQQWIELTIEFYRFAHQAQPESLISALMTNPNSPLQHHIQKLYRFRDSKTIHQGIEAYLNNQSEPDFLQEIDDNLKRVLAFYKEQLRLYPETLKHQHKVHYGPSKDPQKNAMQRALAIPYAANEKPSEQSRFGNTFETINYTVQSLLHQGINEELLIESIRRWQDNARFELKNNIKAYQTLDDTPTAKTVVAHYLAHTGFTSLQHININDLSQIKKLLKHIRHDPELILHVLDKSILKLITLESSILHSDVYNHVDMYHSVQGVSGTPSNFTTYHQRFTFNQSTSLGTDGYIEKIIDEKKTPIRAIEFTNLTTFLHEILKANTDIRALIDISATFAGIPNLEVAQGLADYYHDKPSIQYILYFNEHDVLCACDTQTKKIQVLGTSDPHEINQLLHCTPNERVTYYDQSHTVGTDLKQGLQSCGLCLVNDATEIQAFLQGCMRMRGLEEKQRIEIITSPSLCNISLIELLKRMERNESEQLRENNVYAAMGMMDNWFRTQAMAMLESSDNDNDNKAMIAEALIPFLVDIQSADLEQYSTIYQKISTKTVLEDYKNKLNAKWQDCLTHIIPAPTTMESSTALDAIIERVLPHCQPSALSPQHHEGGTEVQVQKEQLTKKEVQQLNQQQTQFNWLNALKPCIWDQKTLNDFATTGIAQHPEIIQPFSNEPERSLEQNRSTPLNDVCQTSDLFSSTLHVSANYATIYQGQTELLNAALKPIHAVLFRLDDNHQLSAMIIDTQEAGQIHQLLEENDALDGKIWLSSTKPLCLSGKQPHDIEQHPDYDKLLEQIYFFNGECQTLIQQTKPTTWLNRNTQQKIDFFTSCLLPYRDTKSEDIERLSRILLNSPIGLKDIHSQAFTDLSNVDWSQRYPNAFPLEIAECTTLSHAYCKANQHVQTQPLHLDDFELNGCSSQGITQFQHHLETLHTIHELLNKISTNGSIANLTPAEHESLHAFLSTRTSYPLDDPSLTIQVLLSLIQSPWITDKTPFISSLKQNKVLHQTHDELESTPAKPLILLAKALYMEPNNEALLQQVITQADSKFALHALLQHDLTHITTSVLHELLITKSALIDDEIMLNILQHPAYAKSLPLHHLSSHVITSLLQVCPLPRVMALVNDGLIPPSDIKPSWLLTRLHTHPNPVQDSACVHAIMQNFSRQDQSICAATLHILTNQLDSWIKTAEFKTLIQAAETDTTALQTLENVFAALEPQPECLSDVPCAQLGHNGFKAWIKHTQNMTNPQWLKIFSVRNSNDDLALMLKSAPTLPQDILTHILNQGHDSNQMELILQRKEIDATWIKAHYQAFLVEPRTQATIVSALLHDAPLTDATTLHHIINTVDDVKVLESCFQQQLTPQHLLDLSKKSVDAGWKKRILTKALDLFQTHPEGAEHFFITLLSATDPATLNSYQSYIRELTPSIALALALTKLPQLNESTLIWLIKQSKPMASEELYRRILNHPNTNASVLPDLLNAWFQGQHIPVELLIDILNKSKSFPSYHSHTLITKILDQAQNSNVLVDPLFVTQLVEKLDNYQLNDLIKPSTNLSATFFNQLLSEKQTIDDALFLSILTHPAFDETNYLSLVKHLNYNRGKNIVDALNQHSCNTDKMKAQLIQESPNINNKLWHAAFIKTLNNSELTQFLKLNIQNMTANECNDLLDRPDLDADALIAISEIAPTKDKALFEHANRIQQASWNEALDRAIIPKVNTYNVLKDFVLNKDFITFERLSLILELQPNCVSFYIDVLLQKVASSDYTPEENYHLFQWALNRSSSLNCLKPFNIIVPLFTNLEAHASEGKLQLLTTIIERMELSELISYINLLKKPCHDASFKALLTKLKPPNYMFSNQLETYHHFVNFMLSEGNTAEQEQALFTPENIVAILSKKPPIEIATQLLNPIDSAETLNTIVMQIELTAIVTNLILNHRYCDDKVLLTAVGKRPGDPTIKKQLLTSLMTRAHLFESIPLIITVLTDFTPNQGELETLLSHCHHANDLVQIINKVALTTELLEALIKHPQFSDEVLLKAIEKKPYPNALKKQLVAELMPRGHLLEAADGLALIINLIKNYPVDEQMEHLLSHIHTDEGLLSVIDKIDPNKPFIAALLGHPNCSQAVLTQSFQRVYNDARREQMMIKWLDQGHPLDPLIDTISINFIFQMALSSHANVFKEHIASHIHTYLEDASYAEYKLSQLSSETLRNPQALDYLFSLFPEQLTQENDLTKEIFDDRSTLWQMLHHPQLTLDFYQLVVNTIAIKPEMATPKIQTELESAALRLGISAEKMNRFKTEVTKLRSDDNLKPGDDHKPS